MAIEVLLITDVKDLGSVGDVVRVSEGYARNYLLARKYAAPVTEGTRRQLVKIQLQRAAAQQLERESAETLAKKLAGVSCTIPAKTSDDQKLYGSVTAADIVSALQAQGLVLDKDLIQLEAPIKTLGIFNIPVKVHADVTATLKVWVVKE